MSSPVYLDNHATTRVDPRVVAAMLPYWTERYGNAGSTSHAFGAEAKAAVELARQQLAQAIGAADPQELIFTSGATESNNLALRGVAERWQHKGRHLVSVVTEHRAVLDPLDRLSRRGFDVTYLPVEPQAAGEVCGRVDPQRLADSLRPDTILVSVMLANNETGVLQPLDEIGRICAARGVLLHCDATQAVGKLPFDVGRLGADLVSFSAHKLYGPKGVGALYLRRQVPPIRLVPLIDGGGQERGFRSGTLPVPLIVGLATAVTIAVAERPATALQLAELRNRFWQSLQDQVPGCVLNGPPLEPPTAEPRWRLTHNLNVRLEGVEGAAVMLNTPELAMSSGSACTSTRPEPSHVLRALGLTVDQVRSSLRLGLGRFNSPADIELAVPLIAAAVQKLRNLG